MCLVLQLFQVFSIDAWDMDDYETCMDALIAKSDFRFREGLVCPEDGRVDARERFYECINRKDINFNIFSSIFEKYLSKHS